MSRPDDEMPTVIVCGCCGAQAEEVIHAEARIRRGWYCPACKEFTKAILRERLLDDEEKDRD